MRHPHHQDPPNQASPARPHLTCNWQDWAAYLDHVEATDEQKQRIIEELWNIVVAFVDLGWDVGPSDPSKSCGQEIDLADVLRAAVVNSEEHSSEKEEV